MIMIDFKKLFIFTCTTLTIILAIMLYIHNLNIEKLSQKISHLKYDSYLINYSIYNNKNLNSIQFGNALLEMLKENPPDNTSLNSYNNNIEEDYSNIDNQFRIDELERRVEEAEYRAEEAEEKARQSQKRIDDMELDKLLNRNNSYVGY